MPVPFEALIPFGLITTMFGITGSLLYVVKRSHNNGLPPRYGVDVWDERMLRRDMRLTGKFRGQTDDPKAPKEFQTNSQWDYEKTSYFKSKY